MANHGNGDARVVAKDKECKDCKQMFEITQGELDFLRQTFGNDFAEPVRCKPCRDAKKAAKAQNGGAPKRTRTNR
jgi:hypothetical protein